MTAPADQEALIEAASRMAIGPMAQEQWLMFQDLLEALEAVPALLSAARADGWDEGATWMAAHYREPMTDADRARNPHRSQEQK